MRLVCAAMLVASSASAQETRSMLFGRVLDPQGSAVSGAVVTVRNTDTNVSLTFRTNDTGYYEAQLLLPGQYQIDAESAGFKHLSRKGITLPVSSRLEVLLNLEVGGVTETVSVTAEAPLLETNAVSSGRVLDNKTVMELPLMGNSAMLLVKVTPGIQSGGVNNYLALHSNAGGSDYNVAGNVGGNSWTLDGSPNTGPGRRTAYLPYTDAVSEFKVETNNFDAGIGQTSGAAITMISKSGTNSLHGTATWQHFQQRWQGTSFFVKQQYYQRINAAEAAGNKTLANQLRATDKQATGRSNNWGASAGGPLVIPKLFNGRSKFFWFFTYNAFKDVKSEDPSTFNRTVPTAEMRDGNFASLLNVTNQNGKYIVYDPITVAADGARATHFIRTPFPGNVIPKNRFVNPSYDKITKLYPLPNNSPAANQDPTNNYLASKTPYNWNYHAYSNRMDYQISNKWRAFGRWSVNDFGPEDRGDWTYESARGLNVGGLVRNNKGGNFDLVFTQTSSTVWDFNIAMDQFREGNIQPYALSFKASDIGLPTYVDQKAGGLDILPQMAVSGYTTISPSGISTWTRTRPFTSKLEVNHIRGRHSIRAAFDGRWMFRTGGGGGNTSGNFSFTNTYTRRDDDGNAPNSNLGQAWAAFILGIPSSLSINTPDNYAIYNPYYGFFVQDNWRVTPKLTLNLGLRGEYELGYTERYNRMIAGFDPNAALPIAAAAQAAYAAAPIPELSASSFKVQGGSLFAGVGSTPRNLSMNQLMWLPRLGAAYQLNSKTVIRGGYGVFYDTINVNNLSPDQSGFSRGTNPIVSTDFGQSWGIYGPNASPANLKSILNDPFPVRADGTRFDVPTREALGLMAKVGRGWTFTDYNQEHSREQRWRIGIQRQIGQSLVIDAAYAGSRATDIPLNRKLDALPAQYWNTTSTRNDALATNLNSNVTNPFQLKNFASLAQSNPLVYQDMSTLAFYTSTTIRKSQLLRAFPQMNGLNNGTITNGTNRTREFQLSVDKRFSKGFNFNFGYTAQYLRAADFFYNEWDEAPTERVSNNGRPHRIVATGIFEFPFGKGKRFLGAAPKVVDLMFGGWQIAATYEYQPGPLLDFGNVYFYGNIADIPKSDRTFDSWFNTANFERSNAKSPTSFQARVFPTRVDGVRADHTNQWNANMSKSLRLTEKVNMQLRFDALNVANRSQMAGPSTDPLSTNFGRVTSQTAAINRWLQVQARVQF
jgi:hypothetical protein